MAFGDGDDFGSDSSGNADFSSSGGGSGNAANSGSADTGGAQAAVAAAIAEVNANAAQPTDGKWLEAVAVRAAPRIREWDIAECWAWADWPEREERFPDAPKQDIGIDAVARRNDGAHIAIQCKSRQLDAQGVGDPIAAGEIDSFVSASANPFWAERWIVTNGANPLSPNAQSKAAISDPLRPVKLINIAADLAEQQKAYIVEECEHCASDAVFAQRPRPHSGPARTAAPPAPKQSKTCMQNEAVAESVRLLREHAQSDSGGLPIGQARGKIILPCGTGKTRISLRIVEALTPAGGLSIVLCPSIALVAQLRREYLQNAALPIRPLAVCSDKSAAYDPRKEGSRSASADPTVDSSNVSADIVKGKVSTDPADIAQWIQEGRGGDKISVVFGTYQSGRALADALKIADASASVLIADEAHRTAGLRRKRRAKAGELSDEERRVRDFTLCHDNDEMPAAYRVYQTATPRIYDTTKVNWDKAGDWFVRSMDDPETFGVDLYRKSYLEAVNNGWLADYRIIALGVNDPEAYEQANRLARDTESKGRSRLTTAHYLRGLAFALAMGGAVEGADGAALPIKSCIAFMNTVDKSKNMARDLETAAVREWIGKRLSDSADGSDADGNGNGNNASAPRPAADYALQHLDATSNVAKREEAKRRLADADADNPEGVLNVGIFGEGTDSPSLSAVAFLEARRSPIDVVQAVGRAMRTAPGKDMGYIICPILFPPNADPEDWLSSSGMDDGWRELGQILLALRAHDSRIEDELAGLMSLYIPKPPPAVKTIVAVAGGENARIKYGEHQGKPGDAQTAAERVLDGKSSFSDEFAPISPISAGADAPKAVGEDPVPYETKPIDHSQIITGKSNSDGSVEMRIDAVVTDKPKPDGSPGAVNIERSKKKARDMINKGEGTRLAPSSEKRPRRTAAEVAEQRMLDLVEDERLDAISVNLLAKSGLTGNRVMRDLNLLEGAVKEAAHHLAADGLAAALNRHFGLDALNAAARGKQADGCTIAALLMMNAAMLHQRIANGGWMSGISGLDSLKNAVDVVKKINYEWGRILRHDFRVVLEPAVEAINAIDHTGKAAGLERALGHIASEAERIAETYADMGSDHAGPLFNRVMGNQASDGAFFTRPAAASIAARLTLDAVGSADWTNPAVWEAHKTVDLACGSGTLLTAMLTEMKCRARQQGATNARIAALQKLAVEDTIKGLDINAVSLQLAASQLTAGSRGVSYRKMGLHQMPYGPRRGGAGRAAAGTLELLGQRAIVGRDGELDIPDDAIASQTIWEQRGGGDPELEDAVDAVKNARIVIMNPPFTNRVNMGKKFPKETQLELRGRADALEQTLVQNDKGMANFVNKYALAPLFVALADKCLNGDQGVLTMIHPTIALTAASANGQRIAMAQRYHIDTVLTCHQPGQINMSQNTGINESVVLLKRHNGPKPPTRFINLDRMPLDEDDAGDLHECLLRCAKGEIANGWGEVSEWPAERMEAGDWTPAIWRSPELAEAAARFANDDNMQTITEAGLYPQRTDPFLLGYFERTEISAGSFPLLKSKGSNAQTRIQSQPDERWIPKKRDERIRQANGGTYPEADKVVAKAGYLLITAGQDNATGRLTATADDEKYVGVGWMPVTGLSATEAKALAVFINSTPGRLQLMRNLGRKLEFPIYIAGEVSKIRIPNIKDAAVRQTLSDCWERTKDMLVPQFRDGECEVRRLWDGAVADALGWDAAELARLRALLNAEPHVRGLGYGQYADDAE